MRDYYCKELNKVKKIKSGDAGGKLQKSTWPFFELLYFLKEDMSPSPTSGNLETTGDCLQSNVVGEENEMSETLLDNDVPDGEEEDSSMNLTRCETPSASSRSVSSLSEKYVRKRKANIQDEVEKKLLQLEEHKVEFLSNRDDVEKTEDYHFLMSLLPHFKDMPPFQKLSVRNKITQVIIDAKYSSQLH